MKKNTTSTNWFLTFTKPRNELKVVQGLTKLGIVAYTPVRIELRQWSDRKKKVEVPLLPSMVLVSLKEKDANLVFGVEGVVRYMFENGKRAVVFDDEVVAMRDYVSQTDLISSNHLKVGSTVKVPLLNEEATVLAIKGKSCLAKLKKLGCKVTFQLS
jgi:hypothetical protein